MVYVKSSIGLALALLCTLSRAAAQPCPPEASTAVVGVSVAVLRTNGSPVGPIPVDIGEPLIVRMAVFALDTDPITLQPTLAVEGGRMLLTIDGVTSDITPGNGVPRFGRAGCATSAVVYVQVPYTPGRTGQIGITGNYVDGTTGLPGSRVSAGGSTILTVAPGLAVNIRVSQVEICWPSRANALYNVQYRSSSTANTWVTLFTNVAGVGAINCVLDPITLGQPQRYYRVEWVR